VACDGDGQPACRGITVAAGAPGAEDGSCQLPCDPDCELGPVHCWNWHRPAHKPDWHDPAACARRPAG
jgi:hypothetical protein